MKVYFDTNAYRFISDRGEVNEARRRIRSCRIDLVASGENLFETYAIADSATRLRELSTITTIATTFERQPVSFRQAKEVRFAFAHHRRAWIRPIRFTSRIDRFLKDHQQRWRDGCQGELPSAEAYSAYRADAEAGVSQSRQAQKEMRALRVAELEATVARRISDRMLLVRTGFDDPGTFWRLESLMAYDAALLQAHPSSRDLADWLLPYLNGQALEFGGFVTFWLNDVRAEEVPLNRLAGTISYVQLNTKITHGNSIDQLHACQAFEVDALVTADRGLYDAIVASKSIGAAGSAKVCLVDRAASSALTEIERALL